MNARMQGPSQAQASPLITLLDLARRARRAESVAALRFMAVNDSHALARYRQSALWFSGVGVQALSGVVQVEANAPYAQWLDKVCTHFFAHLSAPGTVSSADLPAELAEAWGEWLPPHAYWQPIAGLAGVADAPGGGLLLARDLPWTEPEGALIAEWIDTWRHAWLGLAAPRLNLAQRIWRFLCGDAGAAGRPWWRRRGALWLAALVVVSALPVRLSVLAPGELVPARPAVVRAPLEGVVEVFHVQPNDEVKTGQPLFGFDEVLIRSRLDVARQTLQTAEAEYRQMAQQAVSDVRSKALLASLTGKIEEKRAEALFIEEQLGRAQVTAPQAGIVLFDDPSEWVGRPVTVGERIMRIARTGDVEVEAWVPVADAIPLDPEAEVSLFLNASPLAPVPARLRYFAHEAVERPDGTYAYRVRAEILGETTHRVGLKGSVRLSGDWVPLIYWAMRRPWASVRTTLGW